MNELNFCKISCAQIDWFLRYKSMCPGCFFMPNPIYKKIFQIQAKKEDIEGATRKPVKSTFGHFELRTYLKSAYQNTHSVRFSDQTEHFKRF